jgi:flagellar L-ring protein FlgH
MRAPLRNAALPLVLLPLLCAGCDTFDHIQRPPDFSSPGAMNGIPPTDPLAPTVLAQQQAPQASLAMATQGSLWRSGSKTFFRDPRARSVGDLLTVVVSVDEQAEFQNQSDLQRQTANTASIGNMFGLVGLIGKALPFLKNGNNAVNTAGNEQTNGQADIKRQETITMNVAATVLRVLPNNNLEISGSQEIRLNNELRELEVRGVVRPEDIKSNNTIASDKIAEARISYGGRGVGSDLQRPRWGQDVLNRLQPF